LQGHLLFLPQKTERFIGSDPVKPGVQLRFFLEAIERFPGFYEGILKDIIAVVVINNDLAHMPVQALLVFFYDGSKSLIPLGTPGFKKCNEFVIGTCFANNCFFDVKIAN
jgi:hypothetical protein